MPPEKKPSNKLTKEERAERTKNERITKAEELMEIEKSGVNLSHEEQAIIKKVKKLYPEEFKIIDNAKILKETPITGKSSQFKEAPKPELNTANTTAEKKVINEIKDLSELANIKIEEVIDPKQEEIAVVKAIETGEAKVEEIVSEIEADKEKGENKAEILGDKEGKESLAKDLKPIEEEKKVIVEKTQKAKRAYTKKNPEANNQDQKTPEVKEQPSIALIAEQLDKATQAINKLKEEGKKEAKELANLQALESATTVNTPESQKASIEDVFDSFNEEDEAEYSKSMDAYLEEHSTNKTGLTTEESMKNFHQTEEVQDLLKRIKSRMEKQPTKAEIQKRLEKAEEKQAKLGEKIEAKQAELTEIDKKIGGVADDELEDPYISTEGERLEPLIFDRKNEEVLAGAEQTQQVKKEGFLSGAKEGIINNLNKSLDWWNKDYSERTTGEKVAKSAMSGFFIGAALYFSGEKLDLLPKDTGFAGKVGSRTFMAGLASVVMSSEHIQRALTTVKEEFANLSKAQKIAALGALGVAGVGGFVYLAGAGALATTGLAIGARLGADKYYFNKKIEEKNTNLKSKEEQIAEIKRQIAEEENGNNSEYISLDINALNKNLESITKDIEKLNGELRKVKAYQSLARGAISFAGGLGTMAAVNASKLSWQEILENKKVAPEEIPEAVATDTKTENLDQDVKEITVEENKSPSWLDKAKNWWNSGKKTESISENKYGPSPKELIDNTEGNNPTTDTEEIVQNTNETKNEDSSWWDRITKWRPFGEDNDSEKGETKGPEEAKPEPKPDTDAEQQAAPTKTPTPNEAIVDGKERPGITYVYRDQLRANNDLAQKFAKYKGLDLSKLNDDDYMAGYTKDIAIKLGNMDKAGHEIRLSEKAIDKMAYVLDLDSNNNITSEETNVSTGKVEETRLEGNSFEGSSLEKEYETYDGKEHHYGNNSTKINTPIDTSEPEYPGKVTDAFSITDNTDPSGESVEHPGEVTDADKSKIETKVSTDGYNYESVLSSPYWNDFKYKNFLNFLNVPNPKVHYSPEEYRIFNYMNTEYTEALKKDPGLKEYLSTKSNVNVEDARKLFYSINKEGLKTETIGQSATDAVESNGGKNSKEALEKIFQSNQEFKELANVARDSKYKVGDQEFKYELNHEELKSANTTYQNNLNTIFGEKKQGWYEGKDQSVTKYLDHMKKTGDETPLSKHLNTIRKLGGNFEPKNKWSYKEDIDHYLMRVTLEAQRLGKLDLVKPKIDEPDEVYQGIKTGKTEVIINKTSGDKNDFDDLYEKNSKEYNFDNINKAPGWKDVAKMPIKDLFFHGLFGDDPAAMAEELNNDEKKIFDIVWEKYQEAENVNKEAKDVETFMKENPKMTVKDALEYFSKIIKK